MIPDFTFLYYRDRQFNSSLPLQARPPWGVEVYGLMGGCLGLYDGYALSGSDHRRGKEHRLRKDF